MALTSYVYGETDTTRGTLWVDTVETSTDYTVTAWVTLSTRLESWTRQGYKIVFNYSYEDVIKSENYYESIAPSKDWIDTMTNQRVMPVEKGQSSKSINISTQYSGTSENIVPPPPAGTESGSFAITITVPPLGTYNVTYSAGSVSGVTNLPGAQQKIDGQDLALSNTIPVRSGYNFVGWNTAEDGSGVSFRAAGTYSEDASITLYAQWQIAEYTVQYQPNGNGITSNPPWGKKTNGVNYTITNTLPTRAFYVFTAWNTQPDGSGTEYQPGDTYSTNADLVLYAQWDAVPHSNPVITGPGGTGIPIVIRCDSGGTPDVAGTYASISFDWSTTGANGYMAYIYCNGGEYSVPLSATTSGSVSEVIGGGSLSTYASYNVTILVEDTASGQAQFKTVLSTSYFTLDFAAGGKAIGVGQIAPNPASHPAGLMQISMDLQDGNGGFIDTLRHPKRIQPNTGADLDTYLSSGSWYVVSDADAGTISNIPVSRAGYFYVMDSGVKMQVYMTYIGPVYTRFYSSWASPSTWSSWTQQTGADCVIETGRTGIWTYRKYASGIAECWGKTTVSGTFTLARNAWYAITGGSWTTVSFPSGFFNATPECTVTGRLSTNWNYPLGWVGNLSSASVEFLPVLSGQSTSSVTVSYSIHAIGTWK